jgi:hypothetical protein
MTDDITASLEAEGLARRKAARAARQTPETKAARQKGRLARRRGLDFERKVAKYLQGEKVIASGAYGSGKRGDRLSGDVILGLYRVQCKHTDALATQRRWLDHDKSDILVQCDNNEDIDNALVVMRARTFKAIIELPESVRKAVSE